MGVCGGSMSRGSVFMPSGNTSMENYDLGVVIQYSLC